MLLGTGGEHPDLSHPQQHSRRAACSRPDERSDRRGTGPSPGHRQPQNQGCPKGWGEETAPPLAPGEKALSATTVGSDLLATWREARPPRQVQTGGGAAVVSAHGRHTGLAESARALEPGLPALRAQGAPAPQPRRPLCPCAPHPGPGHGQWGRAGRVPAAPCPRTLATAPALTGVAVLSQTQVAHAPAGRRPVSSVLFPWSVSLPHEVPGGGGAEGRDTLPTLPRRNRSRTRSKRELGDSHSLSTCLCRAARRHLRASPGASPRSPGPASRCVGTAATPPQQCWGHSPGRQGLPGPTPWRAAGAGPRAVGLCWDNAISTPGAPGAVTNHSPACTSCCTTTVLGHCQLSHLTPGPGSPGSSQTPRRPRTTPWTFRSLPPPLRGAPGPARPAPTRSLLRAELCPSKQAPARQAPVPVTGASLGHGVFADAVTST